MLSRWWCRPTPTCCPPPTTTWLAPTQSTTTTLTSPTPSIRCAPYIHWGGIALQFLQQFFFFSFVARLFWNKTANKHELQDSNIVSHPTFCQLFLSLRCEPRSWASRCTRLPTTSLSTGSSLRLIASKLTKQSQVCSQTLKSRRSLFSRPLDPTHPLSSVFQLLQVDCTSKSSKTKRTGIRSQNQCGFHNLS